MFVIGWPEPGFQCVLQCVKVADKRMVCSHMKFDYILFNDPCVMYEGACV